MLCLFQKAFTSFYFINSWKQPWILNGQEPGPPTAKDTQKLEQHILVIIIECTRWLQKIPLGTAEEILKSSGLLLTPPLQLTFTQIGHKSHVLSISSSLHDKQHKSWGGTWWRCLMNSLWGKAWTSFIFCLDDSGYERTEAICFKLVFFFFFLQWMNSGS